MEENPNRTRSEAERLMGLAAKLLGNRDFTSSRDFAILAQETEPLLDGSDQILAVCDVLLAAKKRINNHHDWYSILQIDRRSDDLDLIKKQYRRLALLLHPDKNKFPFADHAFKLVADAWAVLSDPLKKSPYDNELTLFSRIDLSTQGKLLVRRSERPGGRKGNNRDNSYEEDQRMRLSKFWTACPYCYVLYEYPRVYEGCCLRCQKCQRAFHAAVIPSLPPLVPGQDAYYCCWSFFPIGFTTEVSEGKNKAGGEFPTWMPPMFPMTGQQGFGRTEPPLVRAPAPAPAQAAWARVGGEGRNGVVELSDGRNAPIERRQGQKKRGRPRKYPVLT